MRTSALFLKTIRLTVFLLCISLGAKAQFVSISPQQIVACNQYQNCTYTINGYDPSYTYYWYVDNFNNFGSSCYSNGPLAIAGVGQSFNITPSAVGPAAQIIVKMVDGTGTEVAQGGAFLFAATHIFFPVCYDTQNCGTLSVAPWLDQYRTQTNTWSMWYVNGVATGYSNAYWQGPMAQSGYYKFKIKVCTDTLTSDSVYVYGTPKPIVTPGGPTTFCQGDSVRLTLNAGFGVWNWMRNGFAIAGSSTQSILVTESGSYVAQVYTGMGGANQCFQLSDPVVVTVNPGAVITAAATGCTGDSVQLSCNAATTYQWSVNGTTIPGATAQTYWAKTTGAYSVTTTGLTCNTATAKTVTFYPKATVSISQTGAQTLCDGQAMVLSVTGSNIFKYDWYKNNVLIPGSNFSSIAVTKAGNYKCIVTNQVGCTKSSGTAQVSVPVASLPTATVVLQPDTAGIDSYTTCEFGNFSTNYGNKTYMDVSNWYKYFRTADRGILKFDLSSLPPAAPIVSATVRLWADTVLKSGTGNQSLIFRRFIQSWGENSISWYSEPDSTDFQQVSVSTAAITQQNYFSVSITDLVKHWSALPAENFGMLLTFNEYVSPYMWIRLASSDNATAAHRPKLTVNYYYAKLDSSGPLSFCTGGNVKLTTNGGAYTYKWYKNNVQIAGAVDSFYTATSAGAYYVVINNSSGCSVASATANVQVNAPAIANITPAGSPTFCAGTTLKLTADSLAGYMFQWKRNGVNISGATKKYIYVSATAVYSVQVTTPCGVTASASVNVTKITNPTPTITPGGPTTFCNGQSVVLTANTFSGVQYQWKKNGTILAGQTLQNYTAATAGSYTVDETSSGCTNTSAGVTVSVPCRMGSALDADYLQVYPQPAKDVLYVSAEDWDGSTALDIRLCDINGKTLSVVPYNQSPVTINTASLATGMYLIIAEQEGGVQVVRKVVIEK